MKQCLLPTGSGGEIGATLLVGARRQLVYSLSLLLLLDCLGSLHTVVAGVTEHPVQLSQSLHAQEERGSVCVCVWVCVCVCVWGGLYVGA